MKKGKRKKLLNEAITIAREILSGQIGPNEGCAKIGAINDELNWPDELTHFGALAHEQTGHEHLGITAESCIPEIIEEAKKLIATDGQQGAPTDLEKPRP